MTRRITRREALKRTAMVGAGLTLAGARLPVHAVSASEKLNLAVIGIGGRGRANLNALSHPFEDCGPPGAGELSCDAFPMCEG